MGSTPMCYNCVHFNKEDRRGFTCAAFPDSIPRDIYMNEFDHRQPHIGDNGIVYQAIDPNVAYGIIQFEREAQTDVTN